MPVIQEGVPFYMPYSEMGTGCSPEEAYWTPKGFDATGAVEAVRYVMRSTGDTPAILAVNCNAYPEFIAREHPDEAWITSPDQGPLRESADLFRGLRQHDAWLCLSASATDVCPAWE